MIIRRFALLATLVVAFAASALPAGSAGATVAPPADPMPTTLPAAASPDATQPSADPVADPAADPAADPGQGQITESWALAPAGSDNPDDSGNRAELSYASDPGAVINDAVTVYNYGNVAETFHVYATDAFNNDTGEFDLLPGEEPAVDVGTWVTFPQQLLTVPPGKQATIPITITVPVNAAAGDHAGAILAASPTSGADAQGNTVSLERRTGTRLYLRVNGPLTAALEIADVGTTFRQALNPLGGQATVSYRVENLGNVRLGGTVDVSIAGPFGIGERTVRVPDVPELLPGQSVTLHTDLRDVPELGLDTTSVRVTPSPTAAAGGGATVEVRARSFVPPVRLLLIVFVLACVVLVWRLVRRRRAGVEPVAAVARRAPELEHRTT